MEVTLDAEQYDTALVFAPGDYVSGQARYTIQEQQETLESVTIFFEGRSRIGGAKGACYSHGRDSPHLIFQESIVLFQGPYTLVAKEFIWPFQFKFPDFHHGFGFGQTAIPPSFFHSGSSGTPRVLIAYDIRAVAHTSAKLQPAKIAFKSLFLRPVLQQLPFSTMLQSSELSLLFSIPRRTALGGKSIKDILQYHKGCRLPRPNLNQQGFIYLPRVLWQGQTCSVTFRASLRHDIYSSPQITSGVLKSVSITLESSVATESLGVFTERIGHLSLRPEAPLSSNSRELELVPDLGLQTFTNSPRYMPDFCSTALGVNYTHRLLITAVLALDGEEYKCDGEQHVVVLPRMQSSARAISLARATEQLPAYSETLPLSTA